jgi:pyruvate dehydrogenase E1 component alpha subunit
VSASKKTGAKQRNAGKGSGSPRSFADAKGRLEDDDLRRVLELEGHLLKGAKVSMPDELMLQGHALIKFMRALDDRMVKLQRQGRVGFYGTCTGEEAVVLGLASALDIKDWIVPALRQGAAMLWRGYPLLPYVAQVFGNSGDPAKARQMPSHQADASVNYVSWGSCIANQLTQAVGIAKAAKIRGDHSVCAAFVGDGGTSEGDFHVAMNMAALWKVPLVLVCQNNQWAISTPLEVQSRVTRIADKAKAYGMHSVRVDGNDLPAMHEVAAEAAERARAGEGPTLIEALTYRVGAHSTSDDPSRYRDEAVTDSWRGRDPLLRLETYLADRGLRTEADNEAIHQKALFDVDQAIRKVEELPPVDRSSLIEDVMKEPPAALQRQWAEWGSLPNVEAD